MSTASVSRAYLKLIKRFPLLPIASEKQLEEATEVAGELSDRAKTTGLDPEERGYFRVLCGLIEQYEELHHALPPISGTLLVRHLMEARGVTQIDVATATGLPPSALSEVFSGKRKFSTRYVKALAKYFGVSPALFIEE